MISRLRFWGLYLAVVLTSYFAGVLAGLQS